MDRNKVIAKVLKKLAYSPEEQEAYDDVVYEAFQDELNKNGLKAKKNKSLWTISKGKNSLELDEDDFSYELAKKRHVLTLVDDKGNSYKSYFWHESKGFGDEEKIEEKIDMSQVIQYLKKSL